MRLCSVSVKGEILAGIGIDNAVVLVREINRFFDIDLPDTLVELIKKERIEHLRRVTHNLILSDFPGLPLSDISISAPFVNFGNVWQADVNGGLQTENVLHNNPEEALSPGGNVIFSDKMKNVHVAGGIGVVIRRNCENVDEADVQDVILGYTAFLKFTASSNSNSGGRNLYWSFGPCVVTHDEVDFNDSLPVAIFVREKDEFSVRDNMLIPAIRKQVSQLSFKSTLSNGDVVLIPSIGSFKIGRGGRVVCNVKGVGNLEISVA